MRAPGLLSARGPGFFDRLGQEMLFSAAVDEYLEDKTKRLRGNTMEGYISALRRHVLPAFAGREVEEITHDEVQEWVDSIPTYGAAGKAYKTLRQVYRWTVRKHQMRIWDVTQGIELPEAPVVRRPTLSAAEERETLCGIVGQEWEAVVLAQAALGLRRCEAAGLDWSDVDWRTGWVHVQRGAHWVAGRLVEYATKTRLSDRWLKLPRWALARLRALRGRLRSGRLRGALAPHQIAGRFRRLCHRLGLPWVPMTCLRHSWATIALEGGAAIEDVSVALGHSTVDTCIRHYLQSFRSVARRASDAYDGEMLMAA